MAALAFLLLFMGFGRIMSFMTHTPLLGFADSYDMIRIQACHQIWPANLNITPGSGTPEAPLRDYTLNRKVETPCFPSSELIFTGIGVELASLHQQLMGQANISIRTIGWVKASFLIGTALLASLFFYAQKNATAMLLNGGGMLLILSDPAITLYLNTFYTEFSAVYFLYVSVLGIVYLFQHQWKTKYSIPLLIGILGFGLSKPQHAPLALIIGFLLASYLLIKNKQWLLAGAIIMFSVTPVILSSMGVFTPRDEGMALANKVNALGSILQAAKDPQQLLHDMNLPETCDRLSGKTWYHQIYQQEGICHELADTRHAGLLLTLITHPDVFYQLVTSGQPALKIWIFDLYGHVGNQKHGHIKKYFWSISEVLENLSAKVFRLWAWVPTLLVIFYFLFKTARRQSLSESVEGFLMLVVISHGVFFIALIGDGFVDLSKHAHLFVPLIIFQYLLLFTFLCKTILPTNPPPSNPS